MYNKDSYTYIIFYLIQYLPFFGEVFIKMKQLKNERGFTLIEVVASLVIITIVLISFSQLFVQSNKTANYNNEKLTTINLADAALVKLKSLPLTKDTSITDVNSYLIDSIESNPQKMKPVKAIELNGKLYNVTYVASQSKDVITNAKNTEEQLNLIKVIVTVTAPDGKIKGSSEGYVSLE